MQENILDSWDFLTYENPKEASVYASIIHGILLMKEEKLMKELKAPYFGKWMDD